MNFQRYQNHAKNKWIKNQQKENILLSKIQNEEVLGGLRLINGEALETMDKLIEERITVDAIICDPPY